MVFAKHLIGVDPTKTPTKGLVAEMDVSNSGRPAVGLPARSQTFAEPRKTNQECFLACLQQDLRFFHLNKKLSASQSSVIAIKSLLQCYESIAIICSTTPIRSFPMILGAGIAGFRT